MSKTKIIISCAVTGAVHTPSMSPHLPVTADEIAESAIGAAEAGKRSFICTGAVRKTAGPTSLLKRSSHF